MYLFLVVGFEVFSTFRHLYSSAVGFEFLNIYVLCIATVTLGFAVTEAAVSLSGPVAFTSSVVTTRLCVTADSSDGSRAPASRNLGVELSGVP